MSHLERAIILVIDSGGIGEMPDAAMYGDAGADTIGHVADRAGGLHLPNLQRLGLGNLHRVRGVDRLASPDGCYGRMLERSAGKDTTTGHWEMVGLHTEIPFNTYPKGFPDEAIKKFEDAIGVETLGNYPASGTEIIKELGAEHVRTRKPIVYTSADSVFQVACHEDVWPIEELYRICGMAREIMRGPWNVARIIARPFVGEPGSFTRTYRRKDFSVTPPRDTMLDVVRQAGLHVTGVGKIYDIFNGKGIDETHKMTGNLDGLATTERLIREQTQRGVIFTNLVDFDMLYGHRNDEGGYAEALRDLDGALGGILAAMKEGDVLFVTADHGCDPTIKSSTDHTREFVPILAWGPGLAPGVDLGVRDSFGDMGATIIEGFGLDAQGLLGDSFARQLWRERVHA